MGLSIDIFLDHFGTLSDDREAGKVLHPVLEILPVALCGVTAGAEGWEDIEEYGKSKLVLLRESFTHGIPSDDTLRRFFRSVDPKAFREIFAAFVRDVLPEAASRLIAVGGKTPPGAACAVHKDKDTDTDTDTDKGHGRIEIRRCEVTDDIAWLQQTHRWPGMRSIVRITATRIIGGETTNESRYYITDDTPDASLPICAATGQSKTPFTGCSI